MDEVFLDALIDSLRMVPLLFLIYALIEFIEYKYATRLRQNIQRAGKAGPIAGALAGSVPQCGFSVIASTLYTQKYITLGTLIAVYLSTSDEAIPVILSEPGKAALILPLILTKITIALIFGYLIDLFIKKKRNIQENFACRDDDCESKEHHHPDLDEEGCCGHHYEKKEKIHAKELFLHPFVHTAKIFVFIFAITFFINLLVYKIGEDSFEKLFLGQSIFQPFVAALVGLIPNCAASVAITELYLKNAISFGSAVAGLSAGAGLGLLVLVRELKIKRNVFFIILLLYVISVLSGVLIQIFYG